MAPSQIFNRKGYLKDEEIFREGAVGLCLYFVEKGKVRLWRGKGGKKVTLATVEAGGVFGEMALIDDRPRSANATAAEETVLQIIPGDVLQNKLAKADPFIRKLVHILSRNLRQTTEPLPDLMPDENEEKPS